MRLQRLLPALAAGWVIGISATLILAPGLRQVQGQFPSLFYIPLADRSTAFAAVLLVPFAVRWRFVGPGTLIIAVGLLMGSEAMPRLTQWLVNIGCVLLVAAAVLPRHPPRGSELNPGVALGDWSFALYLCHVPVILLTHRFAAAMAPPVVLWFAAVGAALCGAVLIGRLDMMLYVGLKRRIDRARPLLRVALATVFVASMVGFGAAAELHQMHYRQVAAMGDAVGLQIQSTGAAALPDVLAAADGLALTRSDGLRSKVE